MFCGGRRMEERNGNCRASSDIKIVIRWDQWRDLVLQIELFWESVVPNFDRIGGVRKSDLEQRVLEKPSNTFKTRKLKVLPSEFFSFHHEHHSQTPPGNYYQSVAQERKYLHVITSTFLKSVEHVPGCLFNNAKRYNVADDECVF